MEELMQGDMKIACRSVHDFLDAEAKLINSNSFEAELLGFSILISILDAKIKLIKRAFEEMYKTDMLRDYLSQIYRHLDSIIEKEYLNDNSNSCAEHVSPIHSG